MNPHALGVLEYREVMATVAGRALCALGRDRVLALTPGTDRASIQAELEKVDQVRRFAQRARDWTPPEIPDARPGLKRLALDGSVLDPLELYRLAQLLRAGRELWEALAEAREELPALDALREGLHRDRGHEGALRDVVDGEGSVLDSASRELSRIRGRLRRAQQRIVEALERLMGSLSERVVVPDASVTIREGRYVIPVRREGRAEVGGVVLDESATGATLFVEPPVGLRLTGELRELEREEAREVQRILREWTDTLRPALALLQASQEALVTFDSLYARARMAQAWEGFAPELLLAGTRELRIVAGRHPLLLAKEKERVVSFDLQLEAEERVLVVSGPNTGGKSVFLKSVGLICVLAQSGVIPPVGEGTRLPVFTRVFADIGDEQSIVESLSTFSAHLANLEEIVEEANEESLVLIDEMGTGTDPQEGAALSRAILEELAHRGALTVATSHLGALKRLDTPGSGVVNASLQFDPDRIEPTYQLLKGRPGRSYGLAIARRSGFPSRLLDRAEEHLPREEAKMEDLLASLERKEKEASALVASLSRERRESEELRNRLRGREEDLLQRERTATARARAEARQLLLDARQEVEDAIREVRAVAEARQGEEEALQEASRRARRKVEEAARRNRPRGSGRGRGDVPVDLTLGDRVALEGGGSEGVVVELREDRAVVEAAGVRLQVPVADLVFKSSSADSRRKGDAAPAAPSWQGPDPGVEVEVDLRGSRVSEIDLEVDRALDRAVLAGMGEIRIIHGKGTGALRNRVAELLEGDPRVADFRLGQHGEGGAGVTVVKLR